MEGSVQVAAVVDVVGIVAASREKPRILAPDRLGRAEFIRHGVPLFFFGVAEVQISSK